MHRLSKTLTVLPRPGGLHAAITSVELGPEDTALLNEAYRCGSLIQADSDHGEVQCMVTEITRHQEKKGTLIELIEGFTLDVVFAPNRDQITDATLG